MDDPDRRSTYAAEDLVAAWLDAVDPDTGEVGAGLGPDGRTTRVFVPEAEPRFGDPADVGTFVDHVMERLRRRAKELGTGYRGRESAPVDVVAFPGWTKATYRDGTVFLPRRETGGAWALRGLVVLHELAHHLNTGDGAIIDAHGEGFRRTFVQLLGDIGWSEISAMLGAAYEEIGLVRDAPADDGMLAKVGKLLRHAEGAATEAERDAFLGKAQQLATAHSIELAVARASHERTEAAATPTFETMRLGHRGQHSNVRLVALMLAIASANDLRCTIRSDNTGVTLYGFAGDIEVARALYVSLVVQMVADADAYIRSGAHRPTHGRTARAAFYAGWTDRIRERLHAARASARSRVCTPPTSPSTSVTSSPAAVALARKDVEVDDFFAYMKRQHGVRGTWRGGSAVGDHASAFRGRAAADRARLGAAPELPA